MSISKMPILINEIIQTYLFIPLLSIRRKQQYKGNVQL